MLSNLKTRFEQNLIYVSPGTARPWAQGCLAAASRSPGSSVGSTDLFCGAPDLQPLVSTLRFLLFEHNLLEPGSLRPKALNSTLEWQLPGQRPGDRGPNGESFQSP